MRGKIHKIVGGGVMWWCPACLCGHGGPGFTEVSPGTIAPSAIVSGPPICHSNVIGSKVVFHNDCTNGWAGKIVELEDF